MGKATQDEWRHSLASHTVVDIHGYTIADFAYSGSDRVCSANAELVSAVHNHLHAILAAVKAAEKIKKHGGMCAHVVWKINDPRPDCDCGHDDLQDALTKLNEEGRKDHAHCE